MTTESQVPATPEATVAATRAPLSRRRRLLRAVLAVLALYLLVAYVLMPTFWKAYAHRHPAIDSVPGVTITGDDQPGDPINVGLIGTREAVEAALVAAGWHSADPLGLKSDLKIAADTVLERPYVNAPVSNLFLFGRREDLAYEQPVGNDPRQRHHVRFWQCEKRDDQGRILWVGAGTYDVRVGLSHTTGQITHHIAADVDQERDHVIETLQSAGQLDGVQSIDDFHQVKEGKNGGGDPWKTDGRLLVGTLKASDATVPAQ